MRRGAAPAEYYLVPIDECYKLVGLIRTHWRGLSGGTEVWREIGAFFAALKSRAGVRCGGLDMPDLQLAIEGAEVVPYAAAPLLAFKVRIANQPERRNHSHGRAARTNPDRSHPAEIRCERASAPAGPFRRTGSLGANAAKHAVDARERGSSAFYRKYACGYPGAVHVRFQCSRHKILSRSDERRFASVLPIQRQRFLSGRGWGAASCAHLLGQRSEVPLAGKVWKDLMDMYYPNSAWLALQRTRSKSSINSKCAREFLPGKKRWRGR